MRIVIVGAVAAGTSAAAKARRNTEDAEIVIYEKDTSVSYSGCGMPYFIGGEVESALALTPRDPVFFKSKYNVDILTSHEVLAINPINKTVAVKNLLTGDLFDDKYDKLVLATGAVSVVPPINGVALPHAMTLRNIADMHKIKDFINQNSPKTAAIVGTGFIGLELCENLKKLGMQITLIEKLDQVTPGLDPDMSAIVEKHLRTKGIEVITGAIVEKIKENEVLLSDGTLIRAELVIVATGVRPNVGLAMQAGIEIGNLGAIKVNNKMETNLKDIYACGDCIEQIHIVTKKPVYRPLGSTANKTGRIAGENMSGGNLEFRGVLGTAIFRVFDITVAQTGLSEREAINEGFDVLTSHNIKPNKPEYFGGKEMVIKSVADRLNGRLLGVQIVGEEGVDKRIDVFATAITFGAKAADLFHLDLAYAPPFSTTKDPVLYTGMILENALTKGRPLITAEALHKLILSEQKFNLIDTRAEKQYREHHIETAVSMPLEKLREMSEGLDKNLITVTYCNKGTTGNAAQNILRNKGFREVYNISGGHKTYTNRFGKG